ncbi:TetR/AcrR family transcriptional regulator [Streptomyces sp. NBC_01142]|uniref:TetR/AcrR family transcriptional regulator n=1 Tax=Streptomyces sp. NBC_01142 TaxID=2975865 RepID=UPI0022546B5F|nr:TetR/AcrR family transcriptional regulator [Streptomyces sp. NBC_01142]MCX4820742.1 TetR/AcrR family transcriptional regulator [Streptomyces sp. NBC_01142]
MTKTGGRPRGFDRDTALEQALTEFWRHGYEATSIASLTAAMGINPPSLYGAFGDKRKLFTEAVRRYGQTYGAFGGRALAEEPTAHAAVRRLLHEAAQEYTDPGHPPGCMVITAATNCTPAAEDIKAELRALREASKHAIHEKITADLRAGCLAASVDAAALAMFYAATLQGMSTQACDGAGRSDLERLADIAMTAWPS